MCVLVLDAVPGLSGVRVRVSEGERLRLRPPGDVEAGDMGTRREDIDERAVSASISVAGMDHDGSVIVRDDEVVDKGGSGYPTESVV